MESCASFAMKKYINFLFHIPYGNFSFMQFQDYMEKLLGSKAKIKILRVLYRFPGKEFTTREISRLIGISHTGVLKSLKDLEDMNIIEVGTHGKAHLLKLNAESFIVIKILKIFEVERETFKHLIDELRKSTIDMNATSIALFGSIAKKNEDPMSDIDLLVITHDRMSAEKRISELQNKFVKMFGNSISPLIMTPEEFKGRKKFTEDVLNHSVLIKGKKLEHIQELPYES